MATKLKDLKVTKVDFVDVGANPKAHIKLYKNESGTAGEPKAETGSKHESVLKKFFTAIGKAVGMKPEEIDATVEEIEKGGAETFGAKLAERKMRQINDEIWDMCYALQSSLCSIVCDEEVDNKQELMQESLTQFESTMSKAIAQWASGSTASVIKKSSEPVSEEALSFMRYSKERIEEMIAKADSGAGMLPVNAGDGSTMNNEPKGEEETMIDKSLLTPAELAFFEDIEKRCSVDPSSVGKANTGGGKTNTSGNTTDEDEEDEEGTAKGGAGCGTGGKKKPGVKKSASEEDIYAGLHPAVAAELQRLQKRADEADEKELTEIAKKYEIIGKKPEELVPVLKSLKNAGGTAFADMISVLDASVEAVNKSSMFTEIGKSGGYGGNEPDAWAKIEKKADEIQTANPSMSRAMAIDTACQQNPQLVHEYENGR